MCSATPPRADANASSPERRHRHRRRHAESHGVSRLMYAAQQGDVEHVRTIVRWQPYTLFDRDRTGKTALHYCCTSDNVCAAQAADLITMAAPDLVEARDEDGFTPLHLAVIAGNTQLVTFLLANGADVAAVDNEKHSVVHWATVCGETIALRAVLAAGAPASTPDVHGGYPLHYAAQMCGGDKDFHLGLQVLHTLLGHKDINVSVEDGDKRQPLLWAASAGSAKALLALVRAGAAVEAPDRDGLTALHCAASRGHTDCIDTLLTLCGASPDVIDSNGCTALHYAVTLGHADATALLLAHGADPNRQDRKGRSSAHCGCAKGQFETVKLIGSRGANLWLRNARGDFPLHEAAASGRRELVAWLLSMRPSQVNARNNDGRSPLHMAAVNDNVDMCKILLDSGAHINPILRTSKNVFMTPLDCALQRGFRSTAKYLQLHGGVPASRLGSHKTETQANSGISLQIRDDVTFWGDSSSASDQELAGEKSAKKLHKKKFTYRGRNKRTFRSGSESDAKNIQGEKDRISKTGDAKRTTKDTATNTPRHTRDESSTLRKASSKIDYSNEIIINGKTEINIHHTKEITVDADSSTLSPRIEIGSSDKITVPSKSASSEKRPKSAKFSKLNKEKSSETAKQPEFSSRPPSLKKEHLEKRHLSKSASFMGHSTGTSDDTMDTVIDTYKQEDEDIKGTLRDRMLELPELSNTSEEVEEPRELVVEAAIHSEPRTTNIKDSLELEKELSAKIIAQITKQPSDTPEDLKGKEDEIEIQKDISEDTKQIEEEKTLLAEILSTAEENITVNKQSNEIIFKEPDIKNVVVENVVPDNSDNAKLGAEESDHKITEKSGDESTLSQIQDDAKILVSPVKQETLQNEADDSIVREQLEEVPKVTGPLDQTTSVKEENESNEAFGEKIIQDYQEHEEIEWERTDKNETKESILDIEQNQAKNGKPNGGEDKQKTNQAKKDKQNESEESPEEMSVKNKQAPVSKVIGKPREKKTILKESPDSKHTPKQDSKQKADSQTRPGKKQDLKKVKETMAKSKKGSLSEDDVCSSSPEYLSDSIDDTSKPHKSFKVLSKKEACDLNVRKKGKTARKKREEKKPRSKSEESKLKKEKQQQEQGKLKRSKIPAPMFKSPLSKSDRQLDKTVESERKFHSSMDTKVPSLPNIHESSRDRFLREPQRPDSNLSAPILPSVYSDNERGSGSDLEDDARLSPTKRKKVKKKPKTKRRESRSAGSDYESSNLIDSGFEPSPRSSRIPKWRNMSDRGVNMTSVTRTIQTNIRRYHLERKIFQHLLDLKRNQIRAGQHNEAVLVKRAIDQYNQSCASTIGAGRYLADDFTFKSFEKFLYDSLRKLQKIDVAHLRGMPESSENVNPLLCTQSTHRCMHATHAYTGIPCAAYLPSMDHHTIPKIGFNSTSCKPGTARFLPNINKKKAVTLELSHGTDKQVISLPTDRLDQNKRYYVTFTVKGHEGVSSEDNGNGNAHIHSKSD